VVVAAEVTGAAIQALVAVITVGPLADTAEVVAATVTGVVEDGAIAAVAAMAAEDIPGDVEISYTC
jgi:hypothetical protein